MHLGRVVDYEIAMIYQTQSENDIYYTTNPVSKEL